MSVFDLLNSQAVSGDIRLPARSLFDQDGINACVSCAIAACLEAKDQASPALSAMFHFFNVTSNFPNAPNEGMTAWTAYNSWQTYGIASFSTYGLSFDRNNLTAAHAPGPSAKRDALTRLPQQNDLGENPFRQLPTGGAASAEWKSALARSQPILLIFYTNKSYWSMDNRNRPNGPVENTLSSADLEPDSELHAAAILGSSSSKEAFIVQDSRGPAFGSGGQWYLPWNISDGSAIYQAYTFEYP